MADLFWLTRAQIRWIAPYFPLSHGGPRVDDQRVVSGILHIIRNGLRWRAAPAAYGPHKTLYNRFVRWPAKGVWQAVFAALAAAGGPPAEVLLDSIHVKAHRCAAGGKGDHGSRRSGSAAADAPPRSTP